MYTIKSLKDKGVNTVRIYYRDGGSIWVENIRDAIKDYEQYGADSGFDTINMFDLDKRGEMIDEEGHADSLYVLLTLMNGKTPTKIVLNAKVPVDIERHFVPYTPHGRKTTARKTVRKTVRRA